MPYQGRAAKKKAEEAARLAEEARLQEEARLAEEERLAEEAKKISEENKHLDTSDGKLKDLMKWLNSIPLSKKCFTRLDREFSDGALIGEIITFYCPDLCQKKFLRYNSSVNKLSNWEYLNGKIFPRLGFQMKRATIRNILKPWECGRFEKSCVHELLILQLMFKLQKKLGEANAKVFDYRKQPDNEVSCSAKPKKTKNTKHFPTIKRRLIMATDESILSKIEIQIANGTYDDIYGKHKDVELSVCGPEQWLENCGILNKNKRCKTAPKVTSEPEQPSSTVEKATGDQENNKDPVSDLPPAPSENIQPE